MKYSVITFGCRVNQADSLQIEDSLRQRGGEACGPDDAELLIVNSCSVTASADQGVRQTVRRVARANPDVRVVVTGCYASRCPDEVATLPNVVRVVSNQQKDEFGEVLEAIGLGDATRFATGEGPCGATLEPGVAGRTAFTLRVQTGCDEPCSYCIIPTTRGRSRSRHSVDVLNDVARAIEAGYKEIALTGVHLGSYGRDLPTGGSLLDLVRALAQQPADVLFRISSLEPMDCTPALVDLVAASPRLAPHLHLPLQHGSDRILRSMKRPYTAAAYTDIVRHVRRLMPTASLGTDLIVGFPGETDDDFQQMVDVVTALPLSYLHVFPYSDRPDTAASKMPGKVPGELVRARARVLRAIGEQKVRVFRTAQAGTRRKALTVDDGLSAVTDNYLKVALPAQHARNQWIQALI